MSPQARFPGRWASFQTFGKVGEGSAGMALYGLPRRLIFWKARSSRGQRSEEHTSELQSLIRISYAVFCLKKKKKQIYNNPIHIENALKQRMYKTKTKTNCRKSTKQSTT